MLLLLLVNYNVSGQSGVSLVPEGATIYQISDTLNFADGYNHIGKGCYELNLCGLDSIVAKFSLSSTDTIESQFVMVYIGNFLDYAYTSPFTSPYYFKSSENQYVGYKEVINFTAPGDYTVFVCRSHLAPHTPTATTPISVVRFTVHVFYPPTFTISPSDIPECFQDNECTNVSITVNTLTGTVIESDCTIDYGAGGGQEPYNPFGFNTYCAPGLYTVTLTMTNIECGINSATTVVNIPYYCCSPSPTTTNFSTLYDNPMYDDNPNPGEVTLTIGGDLIIDGNYTVSNSNFNMLPDARIIINSGNTLNIQSSHLKAANDCQDRKMWKGIEVNGTGYLNLNDCIIEEAINAVNTKNCMYYTLTNNEFRDNFRHVFTQNMLTPFTGVISNNAFKSTTNLIAPYNTIPQHTAECFRILNCSLFNLTAKNYFSDFDKNGIFIVNSNATIKNQEIFNYTQPTAALYARGIGVVGKNYTKFTSGPTYKVHIVSNSITNGYRGIESTTNLKLDIFSNKISKQKDYGIYCQKLFDAINIYNQNYCDIETNTISETGCCINMNDNRNINTMIQDNNLYSNFSRGILFTELAQNDLAILEIGDNRFTNALASIETKMAPYKSTIWYNDINLYGYQGIIVKNSNSMQINCNDIYSATYGNHPNVFAYQPFSYGIINALSDFTTIQCNDVMNVKFGIQYDGASIHTGILRGNSLLHNRVGFSMFNNSVIGIQNEPAYFRTNGNRWGRESDWAADWAWYNSTAGNMNMLSYNNPSGNSTKIPSEGLMGTPQSVFYPANSVIGGISGTNAIQNSPSSNLPYEYLCVYQVPSCETYGNADDFFKNYPTQTEEVATTLEQKWNVYNHANLDDNPKTLLAIGLYDALNTYPINWSLHKMLQLARIELSTTPVNLLADLQKHLMVIADNNATVYIHEAAKSEYLTLAKNPNEVYAAEGAIGRIMYQYYTDSSYQLEAEDEALLLHYANSCPEELGKAVYKAQSLLEILTHQVFEYKNPCALSDDGLRTLSLHNNDVALADEIIMSPNPASNQVGVLLKHLMDADVVIQLYDYKGMLITNTFIPAGANYAVIPVEQVASGMYFVSITTATQTANLKLCIAH